MKINASARYVVRIRDIMLAVLLAAVFGLEVWLGTSQAARICDTSARQPDNAAVPSVSFSDVMAAAH